MSQILGFSVDTPSESHLSSRAKLILELNLLMTHPKKIKKIKKRPQKDQAALQLTSLPAMKRSNTL